MNFYLDVLPDDSKEVISILESLSITRQFYLAGGTGSALYLGHRLSGDLDFFTYDNFDEPLLISKLSEIGKFHLEQRSEQTVIGILNNTKLAFFGYRYPLLFPLEKIKGINIANLIDIACMKVDAISSRGSKRDFIDVYFIAMVAPLPKILSSFENKYASINYNMMHIKKSLVYFLDAEDDPMPVMIKPVDWDEIKLFFQEEIKRL